MTLSILGIIGIMIVTQISKSYILPKFGATGVHIFVFALAVILAGIQAAITAYPGFGVFIAEAGAFLVASVGTYEVILKKILPEERLLPPYEE